MSWKAVLGRNIEIMVWFTPLTLGGRAFNPLQLGGTQYASDFHFVVFETPTYIYLLYVFEDSKHKVKTRLSEHKYYECLLCVQSFLRRAALLHHYKMHHKVDITDSDKCCTKPQEVMSAKKRRKRIHVIEDQETLGMLRSLQLIARYVWWLDIAKIVS